MPVEVTRLRRWFAAAAIIAILIVAGAYFYAKHRVENALKEVPGKIGVEIQQTAQGFTVSRSEQGHTLFKVQASKAVQFKQGGRAELHDVTITLYGRDSSRYDQIYGQDFEYDPQSGDVTAKGEVQFDLEANPRGAATPDQAPPEAVKNSIHLRTSGLVFNQKTGNAHTKERVEFSIPQAHGSAVGVDYVSKTNLLTLQSQVHVQFTGTTQATVTAARALITKYPRTVVLDGPRVSGSSHDARAQTATLFLRPDNSLDRILAQGNVELDSHGPSSQHTRSDELELTLSGPRDDLQTALLSGNVQMRSSGSQPVQGSAGKVKIDFSGGNLASRIHADENVRLVQIPQSATAGAQSVELDAPAIDASLAHGRRLTVAETAGSSPQIIFRPAGASANPAEQTVVAAGVFKANFDDQGRLTSMHGAPEVRVVSKDPGQPDQITSSDTLDVAFRAGHGIESIVQKGHFSYTQADRKAWAETARYTPSDQMLVLTGSPRISESGMVTTAETMRLGRASGDASANGNVKTTYNDLKTQPSGAMLASSDPIHVTGTSMTAHRSPSVARYSGNVRLWQNANAIEAPIIDFDRDHRIVVAQSTQNRRVSTVLVQQSNDGKVTPVTITSSGLTYTDDQREAHFDGAVVVKGADATMSADRMDVFLAAQGQENDAAADVAASRVDRIVAQGHVVVTQPNRRATGDQLAYTAADDKFIMTGGPPSIFDAEHGKITGVSLTFFRLDDRVIVEGNEANPTLTETRVAR